MSIVLRAGITQSRECQLMMLQLESIRDELLKAAGAAMDIKESIASCAVEVVVVV